MPRECDNRSVGVIIQNPEGEIALFERARFPVGIAPPAGHIDDHGTPEQAAIGEVREESGLIIAASGLIKTAIQGRRVDNICRRPGGDYHNWWLYKAYVYSGKFRPDPDETKGGGWYSSNRLQGLADRTKLFRAGKISAGDWEASPGLEDVWVEFFMELGYVK